MDVLPVIDVAPLTEGEDPGNQSTTATAIDRACREAGFFLVAGHGVDLGLLDRLDAAARRFFSRPEADKAEIAMARGGRAWRGWFPEGAELTAGRPDRKEGIYFGAELPTDDPRVRAGLPLHGPNLFPTSVPALGPAVLAWMEAMTSLGHTLLRGVALGLGLRADWFRHHLTADPTVLFRIFRYPPASHDGGGGDGDGWGVAEHTAYGMLTILAHDGRPGLEVATPAGWLEVPAVEGTFVVNLGDMMERMTAGRYRSTAHRVRPSAGPHDRLSFPFFFDPSWDAEASALALAPADPPGVGADRARWDGANVHEWSGPYGRYLTERVAKVFPALGQDVLA